MQVAIVKYNAGNVQSVIYALERLNIKAILTDREEELKTADKIIFPGVGEASSAMRFLKEKNLDCVLKNLQKPVLGICLGLQLLCQHSEENNTDCLGVFEVNVRKFEASADFKVPHVGWNTISKLESPLFEGIDEKSYVYYVHSFYAETSIHSIAQTDYIHPFSAALHKDNFYAVQFHPEKSGDIGEKILYNFLFKI
ncbi:MAG: imidazole glycerol phosphate synthase subunit HisH [Thermonemataceae bacterium]|nr:imidazole glycerol phosphate synthase subunit HisH [Thermonemataceae bacterium]